MPEELNGDRMALIQTLLQTNDLPTLTNKAAAVLKNPVLVCDSSYHILVASNIHAVTDESWMRGIKRGHWTYEFVAKIHGMGLDRLDGRQRNGAILIEGITAIRRRLDKLAVDGIDLGYYIVLESETPFQQIPEEYYELVTGVLGKEMSIERSRLARPAAHSYESVLTDLLRGNFANRRLFEERIHGSEFDRKTIFRVIMIDMENYRGKSVTEEENLKALIGRFLPYSWSVYDKNNIVVLADFRYKFYQNKEEFLRDFSAFLAASKIRAGISDHFSDLYLLPAFSEQASAALLLGAMFEDSRVLIPYADYNLYKVIADLPKKENLTFYCSEPVLRMERFDRENKTEYLQTLFHYLSAGKSVLATARRMHLHRNTINYRIERIRGLFSLDFDDALGNFQHYFSCLLLFFMHKKETS